MSARSIFFWILVLLCLVTIPLIALYSFGYRYNFEKGIFIYTGSITVKANPQVVSIAIDGQSVDSRANTINNSYHIDGLKPGRHTLTVSASGFRPWHKETTVESGLSTEFWNVLLARETYPVQEYAVSGTQKIYPAPKARLFASVDTRATDNHPETVIIVSDTKTGESQQVFSAQDTTYDTQSHENIEWSPKSDKILFGVTQNNAKEYFVVDVETLETIKLRDIDPEAGGAITVRWDPDQENALIYQNTDAVWRLLLDTDHHKTLLAERVSSYDLSGNFLYSLEVGNGLVWKTSLSNPENRIQITTGTPDQHLADPGASLVVYDENRFYVINYETGSLFLFNNGTKTTSFSRLSSEAKGAQFSNDGKKLLYWGDRDIHVRMTRDWEVQPARSENQDIDVVRLSQPIRNIQWAKDYEHVLFSAGPTIKITELDNRNRSTEDIMTLPSEPQQLVTDFGNNLLYFVYQQSPNTAGTVFGSIPFPESIGLFGFLGN